MANKKETKKVVCTHCGKKQSVNINADLNYTPCKKCKKDSELRPLI